MKGWVPLTLGLLAVVVGAVWTLQGLGYVGGSVMIGRDALGDRRPDRGRGRAGADRRGPAGPQPGPRMTKGKETHSFPLFNI